MLCVAAKMGTAGWSAVLSAGVSGWELYAAREHVRDSYGAWLLYHQGSASNPNWDAATDNLFWADYTAAESAEKQLWLAAGSSSTTAAVLVGRAAVACLPTLAVPEP